MMTTKSPEVEVVNDFEDCFKHRVIEAIKLNQESGVEMVDKIRITAGPWRSYSFQYHLKHEVDDSIVELDFYSGNRYIGFTHTIEEIASTLTREFFETTLFGE